MKKSVCHETLIHNNLEVSVCTLVQKRIIRKEATTMKTIKIVQKRKCIECKRGYCIMPLPVSVLDNRAKNSFFKLL